MRAPWSTAPAALSAALDQETARLRDLPVEPWAGPAVLTPIDITGLYTGPLMLSRAEAMAVPAVARARHLIVGTMARMPLQAHRDGQPLAEQPGWTYRADGAQSPAARTAATVDDLIFYGQSLWLVDRSTDISRQVLRATHIDYDRWDVDLDGVYRVDDRRLGGLEYILIQGLHEGILTFGAPTIRGASRTMNAAVDVAEHPMRLELHDTGDYPMTGAEQRQLVADARSAMASSGGVIYTTPGVESRLHPVDTGSMLVEGRESFAVDVARLIGVPSAIIDAYSRGATMTYSTVADVVTHFLHLGLTLYMTPITARLSLDDVAPRGQEIRFDLDSVLGPAALATPQTTEEPGL